jgi:hypothetical protein
MSHIRNQMPAPLLGRLITVRLSLVAQVIRIDIKLIVAVVKIDIEIAFLFRQQN